LAESSSVSLVLSHVAAEGHTLTLDYQCRGFSPGSVLSVAVVEDDLQSQVTAGENSGALLVHQHVVRRFKTWPLHATGHVALDLPRDLVPPHTSVVGFVQADGPGQIVAGDAIKL
jgi:hypothetical protein